MAFVHGDAKERSAEGIARNELVAADRNLVVTLTEASGTCFGALVYLNCNAQTAKFRSSKLCTYRLSMHAAEKEEEESPMDTSWCAWLLGCIRTKRSAGRSYIMSYLQIQVMHKEVSDLHRPLELATIQCSTETLAVPQIGKASEKILMEHGEFRHMYMPSTATLFLASDTAYITEPYSAPQQPA